MTTVAGLILGLSLFARVARTTFARHGSSSSKKICARRASLTDRGVVSVRKARCSQKRLPASFAALSTGIGASLAPMIIEGSGY